MDLSLEYFKNRFFLAGLALVMTMFAFAAVGNPNIAGTTVPWHWIPEVAEVFFLGAFWADIGPRLLKHPSISMFLLFIVSTIGGFFLSSFLLGYCSLLCLLTCSGIGFPFVLGFFVEQRRRKK